MQLLKITRVTSGSSIAARGYDSCWQIKWSQPVLLRNMAFTSNLTVQQIEASYQLLVTASKSSHAK